MKMRRPSVPGWLRALGEFAIILAGVMILLTAIAAVVYLMTDGAMAVQPHVRSFVVAVLGSFWVGFILLLLIYIVVFILIFAVWAWIGTWSRSSQTGNQQNFRQCARGICRRLGGRGGSDNNFRWEMLALMLIVTFFIALSHPGPPLLVVAGKDLWHSVVGAVQPQAGRAWTYFLYGNYPPPAEAAPGSPAPTWFWWNAFFVLLPITIVYFFVAFSDEIQRGWRKARKMVERHLEAWEQKRAAAQAAPPASQAAAQPGGAQGAGQPAPAPPQAPPAQSRKVFNWAELRDFITLDLVMEALLALGKEVFRGYMQKRRTV